MIKCFATAKIQLYIVSHAQLLGLDMT
jgi:hypothetical protein